ncbi:MAG: UDP-2,3-diacylglucosamine diphosphatase [Balneolaceae bacterium]
MPLRYFISDVHLGAATDDTPESLLAFFDHAASQNAELYILGDLFDYWMEYPNAVPDLHRPVLEALQSYCAAVSPIHLITGNHDNWTRGYFEELGCRVTGEAIELNEPAPTLLLHGDGLADADYGLPRPATHRLLRHPAFVSLYQRLFPLRSGLAIMKWVSGVNRNLGKTDPSRLSEWAREYVKASHFHYIITGHDHVPRVETFAHGIHINCGAFYLHRTLCRYTNSRFELVTWDAATSALSPVKGTNAVNYTP